MGWMIHEMSYRDSCYKGETHFSQSPALLLVTWLSFHVIPCTRPLIEDEQLDLELPGSKTVTTQSQAQKTKTAARRKGLWKSQAMQKAETIKEKKIFQENEMGQGTVGKDICYED